MSETAQSIFAAAMSLSDAEREALTYRLFDSLPPSDDWEEVEEDEIVAEVLRRHQAAVESCAPCSLASDVHARLLRELDAEAPR